MLGRLLATIGMVIVLALLALGGSLYYSWQEMQKPLTLPDAGMTYQLKPGTSLRLLSQDLAAKGLVADPRYVEVWARWVEPGDAIQAGEYLLNPELNIAELIELFRHGQALQHRFTVVEGSRFADFIAQLNALAEKGLIKTTIKQGEHAKVFKQLTGESHVEGWIFPDTYYFSRDDTDAQLLKRAYQSMKKTLETAWASRAPDSPLKTAYEALILASIVEKETGAAEERPTIAGVFVRRLNQDMKLQTDPTVVYGMGDKYKGNIRKADLRRDTPYNTYTRKGLPPTPIALPGAAAIQAVTHPEDSGALFFVAKGGGRHHFSKTYKEHRAAVIKYLLGGKAKRYQGDS